MDASHLYSSRVCPPKPTKQASATDSFVCFFVPVALPALHPVSYCPTSDLPKGQHHPTQNSGRGTANCIPRKGARQTMCEAAVPDSNWTLGQACRDWEAGRGNSEGIGGKRSEERRVGKGGEARCA